MSLSESDPYNGLKLSWRHELTREPVPAISDEGPRPEATPTWGLRDVLMGVAFPFTLWAVALGLAIASGAATDEGASTGEVIGGVVLTLILQAVLLGLAAALTLRKYGLSWRDLGFRPFPSNLYWTAGAVAIGAHVLVISYAAIVTAAGAGALAPQQGLESLFESRAVLPLVGVATVLVAPLAEETFFRGFVFGGLRRYGFFWAALASGLLFASFHVSSRDSAGLVIPFTVIGVAFAGLYHYTGSLWSTITAHLIFNLVSFVALTAIVQSGGSV